MIQEEEIKNAADAHQSQIAYLEHEIEILKSKLQVANDLNTLLTAELEKAKSPWISVEDELPKCKWDERVSKNHSDYCVVLQADGSRYVAQYYCDFKAWSETPYICEWLRNVTHWMPIPELEKIIK